MEKKITSINLFVDQVDWLKLNGISCKKILDMAVEHYEKLSKKPPKRNNLKRKMKPLAIRGGFKISSEKVREAVDCYREFVGSQKPQREKELSNINNEIEAELERLKNGK